MSNDAKSKPIPIPVNIKDLSSYDINTLFDDKKIKERYERMMNSYKEEFKERVSEINKFLSDIAILGKDTKITEENVKIRYKEYLKIEIFKVALEKLLTQRNFDFKNNMLDCMPEVCFNAIYSHVIIDAYISIINEMISNMDIMYATGKDAIKMLRNRF